MKPRTTWSLRVLHKDENIPGIYIVGKFLSREDAERCVRKHQAGDHRYSITKEIKAYDRTGVREDPHQ